MINPINTEDNKNIINLEWRIKYYDRTKRNRRDNKANL